MEGTQENIQQEQNNEAVNTNAEAQQAGNEQQLEQQQETLQPTPAEIAAAYLKENGIEFTSIEDLKKAPVEKEVIKEVNPYADLLDEDDIKFFEYKKETGRGRKDYEALQQDLDKIDPLVWAREKVKRDSGQDLPDNIIDEYLEEELGISLEELDARGKIKLAQFGKDIKDAKKAEQEKYRKPIENKQPPANQEQQQPEFVKLEDGRVMAKTEYEAMVEKQQQYIKEAQEAGNRVVASTFKITVDDNGTPRELNYSYEFADDDRRSAVSDATDINSVIASYKTENGFNHEQFQEDMFWRNPKNREKAITSIVNKARAEAIEEVLKQRGNVNFSASLPLQGQSKDGVKIVSRAEAFSSKR